MNVTRVFARPACGFQPGTQLLAEHRIVGAEAVDDASAEPVEQFPPAFPGIAERHRNELQRLSSADGTFNRPPTLEFESLPVQVVAPLAAGIGANDDVEAQQLGAYRSNLLEQHRRQVRVDRDAHRRRRHPRHALLHGIGDGRSDERHRRGTDGACRLAKEDSAPGFDRRVLVGCKREAGDDEIRRRRPDVVQRAFGVCLWYDRDVGLVQRADQQFAERDITAAGNDQDGVGHLCGCRRKVQREFGALVGERRFREIAAVELHEFVDQRARNREVGARLRPLARSVAAGTLSADESAQPYRDLRIGDGEHRFDRLRLTFTTWEQA